MFEKFTDKAIKSMMLAQEESRRLKHNYVGTEQVLLGLLAEGTGLASKVLKAHGLNLRTLRTEVEKYIGQGTGYVGLDIPFTPRVKNCLRLTWEEAQQLGHDYVDTAHLLLGLIREEEGIALRILTTNFGIDIKELRQTILKGLKDGDASAPHVGKGSSSKTPTLDQFGTDLTQKARDNELDPVIGRTAELERMIQILGRRTKNNPVLIGEPGVGKTAVAEGLALKIVAKQVPTSLQEKRVVTLEMSSLIAGTKYRGEFEERVKKIVDEVKAAKNVILVIDEIHTMIGAGATEGSVDAANILKPGLSRGEMQVIGASTLDEYRKHFEKDAALARRFQPIMVGEPSIDEAIQILHGLRERYEAHHKLHISTEAVEAAVKMSERYISDRFLPDKAIDLIDEAASRVRFYSEEETPSVTVDDIAAVLAAWTGIPAQKLNETETQRLLVMEEILHQKVIGQHDAVVAISRAIRRSRVGLKNPNRPIGSFVFAGPTGVGKTELAKALAEFFFGKPESFIRVDMSEYMEKHSVSRMVGSPPGYVGHDDAGQLTEAVRRHPHSVILFDEIEKAHPDVFNIMLQILEDGHLTDSKGRKVDFKNTIIILTSNVGAKAIGKGTSLGFSTNAAESNYRGMKDTVFSEMKNVFRPEFLNRLDEVIVFHPLSRDEIGQILDIMLNEISSRTREHGFELQLTPALKNKLCEDGYSPEFGARPLRRAIQREIEDGLAEAILTERVQKVGVIIADLNSEGVVVFSNGMPTVTA